MLARRNWVRSSASPWNVQYVRYSFCSDKAKTHPECDSTVTAAAAPSLPFFLSLRLAQNKTRTLLTSYNIF